MFDGLFEDGCWLGSWLTSAWGCLQVLCAAIFVEVEELACGGQTCEGGFMRDLCRMFMDSLQGLGLDCLYSICFRV